MEKKLYEIEEDFLSVVAELEEGELTPELEEKLKITREEFKTKMENYAKFIRQRELNIEARKKEIERLSDYNKKEEKTLDYLKERMKDAMKMFGEKKVETSLFKISLGSSTFVEILDESKIPTEFLRTPPVPKPEPDKTKIKEFLKDFADSELEWAKLGTRNSIKIS